MSRPLNVLQIISDQHQAAATGYEGHPQAITPNLDRLAAQGMRFSRAYTNNPICTPTRVSVLSGQYCHNHGYYGLSGPTPRDLPDYLSHLGAHSYKTAILGKLHLPNNPHDWLIDKVDFHRELCDDHNVTGAYHQFAVAQGVADEIDYGGIPGLPGRQQNEARPSKLTYGQTVEGFTNTQAMSFIDSCADQPWAMQVSYFRPHQCYTPPQEFWDLYPDDLELPYGWHAEDYPGEDRPPHFQRMAQGGRTVPGKYEPTDAIERARRVWHGYLGCVSMVDHAVGELLSHLETCGQLDNTIVIYHSDHGAYSGTFGVSEKAPGICSEQVCRIPYIWRVPGMTQAGSVCEHFAEQVDLAPTFISLCGVEPMRSVDGKDITPLLRGEDAPVRQVAVTEHPWSKSVRWKQWRFVHYPRDMFEGQDVGELYDIEADPMETTNLYRSAEHQPIVAECRRRLVDWLVQTSGIVTSLPNPPGVRGRGEPIRQSTAHLAEAKELNYL